MINYSAPDRYIGGQIMAVSGPLARSIKDLELGYDAMKQPNYDDPWWTPISQDLPTLNKKIALLSEELNSISSNEEISEFIGAYNYVINESFVDVKRYSSLLPREVLSKVFNSKSGVRLLSDANNRDKYIVDIVKFNSPSVTEIDDVLSEYTSFGEDVISTKMSQIINEDVFQTARVNLNNLIFYRSLIMKSKLYLFPLIFIFVTS